MHVCGQPASWRAYAGPTGTDEEHPVVAPPPRREHGIGSGQWVVLEDGHMLTIDEEVVMRELEAAGKRVLERTGWTTPIAWPVIR